MNDDDADERPQYLTVAEAARELGLSVRTLTRWIQEDRIPSVVASSETLVSRRTIAAMVSRPGQYGRDGDEIGSDP